MKIFGDIEDAAVEALMPLKKSKKIRTLDFYDGQLDQEELSAITLQFPAVYVVCGDLRNQENNRINESKIGLSIIVGDSNLRGKSATRGDYTSAGIYYILQSIFEIIHNQKLLPAPWTPFTLRAVNQVVNSRKYRLWVYGMEYEAKGIIQCQ